MNRSINNIIIILLSASLQLNTSYRAEIFSAYINNKMDLWRGVIDRMDTISDKSNDLLLELVNYQYGYIGYCIGFDKENEAKRYLGMAQKNIDFLDKKKYNPSVINAYKSAFYGFRIGLNPITAPVNGLKSIDCAKTAMRLDPENWLGYVQHGNIQFYMPSTFGGSKKEALGYYLKARDLLEKEPDSASENWNYMSLLIVIGQTYTYLKDFISAQRVFENILEIEPGFLYVRDDLYPKLLKKMGK